MPAAPDGHGTRRHRPRRTPALVGLVIAVLASCSTARSAPSGQSPVPSPDPSAGTPSTDPTSSAPTALAPLTMLPAPDAAAAARGTVAVAVDLYDGGPAPVGVSAADIVFEDLPVAGRSRAVALLQSADARVGPVGQTEPVDGDLLELAHPVFAYSGGPGNFVRQLGGPVVDVSALRRPDLYTGTGSSQQIDTAGARRVSAGTRPPPLFSYRDAGAPAVSDGKPAARVSVVVPGHRARTWTWDPAARKWTDAERAVSATNVLLLTVDYKTVPVGRTGQVIASAKVSGQGAAWVLGSGDATPGNWFHPGPLTAFNMTSTPGKLPIRLLAGSTWVVLLPAGATVAATP